MEDMLDWSSVARSIGFKKVTNYHFLACFGVNFVICELLWLWISPYCEKLQPKHLLYCLYYLKCYPLQSETESILNIDHKTFFKWVWLVVDLLYEHLDMVGLSVHI